VPKEWSDIRTGDWTSNDKKIGVGINASPSVDEWLNGFETPGVFIGASKTLAEQGVQGYFDAEADYGTKNCESGQGAEDYSGNGLTGKYEIFDNCGSTSSQWIVLVAAPEDVSYLVEFNFTSTSDKDFAAANHILQAFEILKAVK
jgi:serine protease Do